MSGAASNASTKCLLRNFIAIAIDVFSNLRRLNQASINGILAIYDGFRIVNLSARYGTKPRQDSSVVVFLPFHGCMDNLFSSSLELDIWITDFRADPNTFGLSD